MNQKHDLITKQKNKHNTKKCIYFAFGLLTVFIIFILYVATHTTLFPSFEQSSNEQESVYQLQIDIKKVSHQDMNGEITEGKEIILNQIKNYEPHMSSIPFLYTKYFDSMDDCMQYIGLEIDYYSPNPDAPVTLNVLGNEAGDITQIVIMNDYELYGNRVHFWYYIFTDLADVTYDAILPENAPNESFENSHILFKSAQPEFNTFDIQTALLGNGTKVPMIISNPNANNVISADSYFSQDEIVYSIHVAANPTSKATAEETMQTILDTMQ